MGNPSDGSYPCEPDWNLPDEDESVFDALETHSLGRLCAFTQSYEIQSQQHHYLHQRVSQGTKESSLAYP